MEHEFTFDSKDVARRSFLEMRQQFITWNSNAFESEEFKNQVDEIIKERIQKKRN